MATKTTWKNRINKVLAANTKGSHSDQYWEGVKAVWEALAAAGVSVTILEAKYREDESGTPCEKKWTFQAEVEGFTFTGVLTAHGAGSVKDPLDRYDISSYVC